MEIYRFLKTIPYEAAHPYGVDIDRRLLFVHPEGMGLPGCPCVIINEFEVMLPDHEIWHLGGQMQQWANTGVLREILPYYGNNITSRVECFLIWRNHNGLNPISIV